MINPATKPPFALHFAKVKVSGRHLCYGSEVSDVRAHIASRKRSTPKFWEHTSRVSKQTTRCSSLSWKRRFACAIMTFSLSATTRTDVCAIIVIRLLFPGAGVQQIETMHSAVTLCASANSEIIYTAAAFASISLTRNANHNYAAPHFWKNCFE